MAEELKDKPSNDYFRFGPPTNLVGELQDSRNIAVYIFKRGTRSTHQNLSALWKDADPDIPILKAAKAEYAKLQ